MVYQIKKKYDRAVNALLIADVALMVAIVTYQVIARKLFSDSPIWTGEASRFLMVWLIFTGSAVGFRESEHLGVDYFVTLLPIGVRKVVVFIINVILVILMGFLVYQGIKLSLFVRIQVSSAMGVSMGIPYMAIPIGALMMAVEIVWKMIADRKAPAKGEVQA